MLQAMVPSLLRHAAIHFQVTAQEFLEIGHFLIKVQFCRHVSFFVSDFQKKNQTVDDTKHILMNNGLLSSLLRVVDIFLVE
jgi:hypothetical protein